MGMYDIVMVPCPTCGERIESQSKSGDCVLATYRLEDAPDAVLLDVNRHAPFVCAKCGTSFAVERAMCTRSVHWSNDSEEDSVRCPIHDAHDNAGRCTCSNIVKALRKALMEACSLATTHRPEDREEILRLIKLAHGAS
jgi:endogenous inhibitor of DNA gyrase (YacG/DUF329 family)